MRYEIHSEGSQLHYHRCHHKGSTGLAGRLHITQVNVESGENVVSEYSNVKVVPLTNKTWVATWYENRLSGGGSYIAARIMSSSPIVIPGTINAQVIIDAKPNKPVVFTASEFFNIGTTNITALPFDILEITQVDPSLTINWYDTKDPVITVTESDIRSNRAVEITSNGKNPNPAVTTKTCKNGICSEERTTTLATAFSLGSANGEQIPAWLKVGGGIGAGVLVAGIVGLGIFAVCRHNKKQKPRRQQTHETLKRHAKFGQSTDEALSENTNTQALMP